MASNDTAEGLELDSDFGNESAGEASDYISGLESDTTSLITAARSHTFENGRRYHGYKDGKYMVPNDEAEQDRMDLFHHCILMALRGELTAAPLGNEWNPQRILDVGTGSGIWAIDIADQHPEAEVTGVDLSPIQPHWVPPNVKFEVDDTEEVWQYQDNSFDYIHLRHMAGHITDWPRLYEQAFKALKPGGWIEVQDVGDYACSDDGSVPDTCALRKYLAYLDEAFGLCGKQFRSVAPSVAEGLKDVGYVDVGQKVTKLPFGPWAKARRDKELGLYWRQNCLDGIESYALAPFTRILGWERKKVDDFVIDVCNDLRNPKFHGYAKFYCSYGRKPSEENP